MNADLKTNPILGSPDWATIEKFCMTSKDKNVLSSLKKVKTAITDLTTFIASFKTEINKKIEILGSAIATVAEEVKIERRKRLASEAELLSPTIYMIGVPQNSISIQEQRNETPEETWKQVQTVLNNLEFPNPEARVAHVNRLPAKPYVDKNGKSKLTNTIRIRFINKFDKFNLFSALAKKGKNLPTIKVRNAIPRDLLSVNKDLEIITSMWRQNEQGLKTRINIHGGEIFIETKKPSENCFIRVPANVMENQLRELREKRKEETKPNQTNEDDQQAKKTSGVVRQSSPNLGNNAKRNRT